MDHAFGGLVTLDFKLDSEKKQMQATLVNVECVFNVGNEVRVVAGVYQGVEGYLVQKYKDNFTICQSGTQQEIDVSKYYLDRRPVDRTLQGYMAAPQYIDPPEEPKSIEIGDYIQVTVSDLIGKGGLVLWAAGEFIWFQDETDIQSVNDRTPDRIPFLRVQAAVVKRMRLPGTLKFTRERGYDVRPGDVVSVACGPEFRAKGVVTAVDFLNTQLTLETEGNHALIKVPICFVMKMQIVDLDNFKKFINKEVFIIRGAKKGFPATLYALSLDDCVITVHGLPRMNAKHCDVATTYGCRLNSAMLEWHEFTSFCEMCRKSHVVPPPRSLTPPPERLIPVEPSPSSSWTSWSPEDLASAGPQIDTGPSTEDPWVVNPSDTQPAAEPTAPNPHAGLGTFQSTSTLTMRSVPRIHQIPGGEIDLFCGPNGIAPLGHISAWCNAKTAGGARVDYHIPIEFLTPAQLRKKGQECFIMSNNLFITNPRNIDNLVPLYAQQIILIQTPGMAPPAKQVHFLEPASNPGPTNSLQFPSTHDMYIWANTIKAKAPCFIRDILAMREIATKGSNGSLYWLGHIPCHIVHIVGVLVGINVSDRSTVYTVNDSTAVIECMLRHPPPYANVDRKSMSAEEWRALCKIIPPPPPHVTAIGYLVEVIGTVMPFHGGCWITAISMKGCESTNDQWKHWVTVIELHKSKYSVPKPFKIPLEKDSDVLQNSVKGSVSEPSSQTSCSTGLPHPSQL
ncbi:hypothetical protein EDD22DRAFT_961390 [Suillus occidentalis]|nr:hypothetical protein EDD22DRAFT_961390 [Suillus occidentalis]